MKLLAKFLIWAALVCLLGLIGLLLLVFDDRPLLEGRATMSAEKIQRAKQVFNRNDPRRLRSGSMVTARLEQEDLNLAFNYFANQYADAVAGLEIEHARAIIKVTLNLPANMIGRYLNLQIILKQTNNLPVIDNIKMGSLGIPPNVAVTLFHYGLDLAKPWFDLKTFLGLVKRFRFESHWLALTYQWQANLPEKLTSGFLSAQERERIRIYQRRLAALTLGRVGGFDLTDLLQPVFELAKQRGQTGDAVAENRAPILALTFYVNQIPLDKIIPDAKNWEQPIWRRVNLNGRDDFSKHYMVSAMLAAFAGTPLADAVGLFKEIEDSRGGSGFSFNDLAADRAGTRMGELAIDGDKHAGKIQRFLATAKEKDIMPFTGDLPEFIPEAEFKRSYGGAEGQAYRQMMADIELRVSALPINRE